MYTPANVPNDPADIPQFLYLELSRLAESLNSSNQLLKLTTSYAQPSRVTEGDIALADGTSWNPGAGAGFYGYRSGAWRKLD